MEQLTYFTIKPMEWKHTPTEDYGSEDEYYEKWEARCRLFSYMIEHDIRHDTWTGWFCFDEYHNDGPFDAGSSLEEAKKNAFEHLKERLLVVLSEVPEISNGCEKET